LQRVLAEQQPAASKKKAQSLAVKRIALDLHAVPHTLSFFASANFCVLNVHRLVHKRNNLVLGYAIQARGSFESLHAMLTALHNAPTAKILHIQSVERVSDTALTIEFFVKGH
jgi:hypothetical protein